MPHTFEHDGVSVTYHPAIVKTRLKRGRMITKLMNAHNLVTSDPQDGQSIVSDAEFDDFLEYANHLAQSHAPGASWWVDENASPEAIREGYEAFLNADADLFDLLRQARTAVSPPKKTTVSTPKT